jgi:hypothetical protein
MSRETIRVSISHYNRPIDDGSTRTGVLKPRGLEKYDQDFASNLPFVPVR